MKLSTASEENSSSPMRPPAGVHRSDLLAEMNLLNRRLLFEMVGLRVSKCPSRPWKSEDSRKSSILSLKTSADSRRTRDSRSPSSEEKNSFLTTIKVF